MTSQVSFFTSKPINIGQAEHPVHIQLRIHDCENREYPAELTAGEYFVKWKIDMSEDDLKELNRQFQEKSEQCITDVESWENLTSKELEEIAYPLAEAGHAAYKRVFGDPQVRSKIEDILRSIGEQHNIVSIQVTSETFSLPWELLYPVDILKPTSFRYFWGMNHIVYRLIPQKERPAAQLPTNRIKFKSVPKFGLFTDLSLPHVSEKEIPFFEKLHEAGTIVLYQLARLNPTKKKKELTKFRAFWGNSLNIAHFACHAVYGEGPDKTEMTLSDEFYISLQDMDNFEVKLNGHPLVVMNACETGNLNPLYTKNFAADFIKRGAIGVVATECAIPDKFAAVFAESLYNLLLAEEPLGKSLLVLRKSSYEQNHDPTGLLYSMYAPPSIRLEKS